MDMVNEETFRINPQCTLINANNSFMAWRVERVRQNRRAMMTFSGFARVSFPRVRVRNCVTEVKLTSSGYWPAYRLERNQTPSPLMLAEGESMNDCIDNSFLIIKQIYMTSKFIE